MKENLNVQLLTKAFRLPPRAETYVKVLSNADDGLEESLFRDKLKNIKPALITNFQYELKKLETKGIFIIGYEPNQNKRIIKLQPLEEMNRLIEESIKEKPIEKQAAPSDTKISPTEIGKQIIDYLSSLPGEDKTARMSDVMDYINETNGYNLSQFRFSTLVQKIRDQFPSITIIKNGTSATLLKLGNDKAIVPPTCPDAEGVITFGGKLLNKVSSKDLASIESVMKRVGIDKSFHEYLSELIEYVMITIVTKSSVPANVITFDSGLLSKYLFLKRYFLTKDMRDFDHILQATVKEYIEQEYDENFAITKFGDILSGTNNPAMLLKMKELLEKKLKIAKAISSDAQQGSEKPIDPLK
jgi:hypothetical protein